MIGVSMLKQMHKLRFVHLYEWQVMIWPLKGGTGVSFHLAACLVGTTIGNGTIRHCLL